jgi:hypothetical protein
VEEKIISVEGNILRIELNVGEEGKYICEANNNTA